VTRPGHPIVRHIDDHFVLEQEEMYGEFFDIPEPECTFLISSFDGGEVFRSGCTWTRGSGKVVYFRPGHETFHSYHNPTVLKVIENAVRWAAPAGAPPHTFGKREGGWLKPSQP
jgi:trehalose utilization protein